MKKQLFYAIAAMAVAGATFTSCKEKNEGILLSGETSEVKFGVNVLKSEASDNVQYAPADSIYFNGEIRTVPVNDIYIVPMVDDITQKPVLIGNIPATTTDKKATSTPKDITVLKETNRFMVYANAGKLDVDQNFKPADLKFTLPTITAYSEDDIVPGARYDYPVYIYGDTKTNADNFQVGRGLSWNDAEWKNFAADDDLGGTYPYVNVKGVTYAVGSLAAAVYHGDYTSGVVLGEDETMEIAGGSSSNDMTEWLTRNVDLLGITVADQPAELDYQFKPNYDITPATVYDPMSNGDNAKVIKSLDDFSNANKMVFNNAGDKANTFVVVAQEKEGTEVVVNLVFKSKSTTPFKFKGNKGMSGLIKNEEVFYIATTLKPKTTDPVTPISGHIFANGYTTMLNAKITAWETAKPNIQTNVDVEIGIEVNLTWQEGHTYDEEI